MGKHLRQSALLSMCIVAMLAGGLWACAEPAPLPTPTTPAASPLAPTQPSITARPQPVSTAEPRAPAQATATVGQARAPSVDYLALKTLARGYLTTPNELRQIAAIARLGNEPYATALQKELVYARDSLGQDDLEVPSRLTFNDDIDKPKYLSLGAKYAYAWAIAYNVLRDSDPQQAEIYAQRARDLIMAMPERDTQVRNYQNNTRLNLSVFIQNFVYTADLLADWTADGENQPFAESADAQKLKEWLGTAIVRYPYNAAHTRVNNWSAWARLSTAVIADYVGDAAPLYVQQLFKDQSGAYQVDSNKSCDSEDSGTCVQVDAHTMYDDALQLHFDMVDGKLYEFSFSSCDGSGSKSMIRPDGGLPDELRRQYACDTTHIDDTYGAAARYSQFAVEAMVSLAEVAWRRGDSRLYTHIDSATGRGALYRSVLFLLGNNVTLTRGSMLEMVNRFYTYQRRVETDADKAREFEQLLSYDLPGILKRQGDWPEGVGFVSFGTLTHGFAPGEALRPPPMVAAR